MAQKQQTKGARTLKPTSFKFDSKINNTKAAKSRDVRGSQSPNVVAPCGNPKSFSKYMKYMRQVKSRNLQVQRQADFYMQSGPRQQRAQSAVLRGKSGAKTRNRRSGTVVLSEGAEADAGSAVTILNLPLPGGARGQARTLNRFHLGDAEPPSEHLQQSSKGRVGSTLYGFEDLLQNRKNSIKESEQEYNHTAIWGKRDTLVESSALVYENM